jgi:hypothetical protein
MTMLRQIGWHGSSLPRSGIEPAASVRHVTLVALMVTT